MSEGITHSGVVTFHELAPRLTRIEVNLDIDPGSLIEKAARGMRHVKRAVRADLARYKAFIEMQEIETGAWRGVIEDGELVDPHDDSYDEERDYSDIEELREEAESSEDEDRSQDEDEDEELPRDRTGRFQRGAGAKTDREIAAASSGSSSRSKGSSSRSSSGSSSKSSGKRQSSRTRGATNGTSSSKRSSGSSSSRRRPSSRS